MEKKNIYILVIVVVLVGTGTGLGVYYGLINQQSKEEKILLFFGSGVKQNFSMSMEDLKSKKYTQVENQLFYTLNFDGNITTMGYFSGVSLKSILTEKNLLEPGAENYTGIGLDLYNPGAIWGMLNISNVMNNPESLCIIAYGGTDFSSLDVLPRLMINQSIVAPTVPTIRASRYCVSNVTSIFIA